MKNQKTSSPNHQLPGSASHAVPCARVCACACTCVRVRACPRALWAMSLIARPCSIYYKYPWHILYITPLARAPSHAHSLARPPSRTRALSPARPRARSRTRALSRARAPSRPARTPGIPHPLHKQPPHSRGQLVATWAAMFPEPFPSSWRQRWCSPHRRLRPHWSSPHWRPRPCWCSVWHALSVWLVAQRASGCSTSLSL